MTRKKTHGTYWSEGVMSRYTIYGVVTTTIVVAIGVAFMLRSSLDTPHVVWNLQGKHLSGLFDGTSRTTDSVEYWRNLSTKWHMPGDAMSGAPCDARRSRSLRTRVSELLRSKFGFVATVQAAGWCGAPRSAPCPDPACAAEYCWAGQDDCQEDSSSCLCYEIKDGTCH